MNALIQGSIVCPLWDPFQERENRQRFGRMTIKELKQANSLTVTTGREAAHGWVLVRREDYALVNPYVVNLQLAIKDEKPGRPQLTFSGLTVVQARCVSRGVASDPDAIYLVELTDGKGILANRWFQYPLPVQHYSSCQYNIRSPAYPGGYYSLSTNAGTPWTWSGMIGDLWSQQSAFLGTYPGLPITPIQDVEGWCFPGKGAWCALNDVVDHLGCSIASNLLSPTPYSIVSLGAVDAAFTAMQAASANLLQDDLEYIDVGSGRVPGQVLVLFHRRNQYYGTEETIRNDAWQWQTSFNYGVYVSAPAQFSAAQGMHYIWVEMTVQFDINNIPLPGDVAAANAVAAERAAEYYLRAYRGTLGYMHQVYNGALPFYVGSQVDVVRWRMTRKVEDGKERYGWITEIMRGGVFAESEP